MHIVVGIFVQGHKPTCEMYVYECFWSHCLLQCAHMKYICLVSHTVSHNAKIVLNVM